MDDGAKGSRSHSGRTKGVGVYDIAEDALEAYEWPDTLTDAKLLERLLELNHERAAASIE